MDCVRCCKYLSFLSQHAGRHLSVILTNTVPLEVDWGRLIWVTCLRTHNASLRWIHFHLTQSPGSLYNVSSLGESAGNLGPVSISVCWSTYPQSTYLRDLCKKSFITRKSDKEALIYILGFFLYRSHLRPNRNTIFLVIKVK